MACALGRPSPLAPYPIEYPSMPSSVITRTRGYSQVTGSSAGIGVPKYQGLASISSRRTSTPVIFICHPCASFRLQFPADSDYVLHVGLVGEGVVDREDGAVGQLHRVRVADVVEVPGGRA